MKRFFSALLSLTMILALVAAMGISVSAKDGDVLYKVNFKGDSVYSPSLWQTAETGSDVSTVEVSEDGNSVTFTKPTAVKGKRIFWGGAFSGFEFGEGKQYTVEMKVNTGYSGAYTIYNMGVYVNSFATAEKNNALADSLMGYYGTPSEALDTASYGAGNKAWGLYRSDATNYIKDMPGATDDNGYATVAIEVDGYRLNLFKSGVDGMILIDSIFLSPTSENTLGLNFYWYNAGYFTVKDAVVLEGLKYSTASGFAFPAETQWVPHTPAAPTLTMDTYNAALAGAKLYDINFAGDENFNPQNIVVVDPQLVIETSADGSCVNINKGPEDTGDSSKGKVGYWGGTIGTLKYTPDTVYTFTYKIKSDKLRAATLINLDDGMSSHKKFFNFYGNFDGTDKSDMVIQQSGSKIKGQLKNTTSYTKFSSLETNIAYDAEGYAEMAFTIEGYTWHVFYKGTNGEWTLFETYAATEADFAIAPYVACGTYIYWETASYSMKDAALYKGTLTDIANYVPPVETTEPAPETTEPAPETTEPVTPPATGDSFVVFAVVASVAVIGVAVVAKRREN